MLIIAGLQEAVRKVKAPDRRKMMVVTTFQVWTMHLFVVRHVEMNLVNVPHPMAQ